MATGDLAFGAAVFIGPAAAFFGAAACLAFVAFAVAALTRRAAFGGKWASMANLPLDQRLSLRPFFFLIVPGMTTSFFLGQLLPTDSKPELKQNK